MARTTTTQTFATQMGTAMKGRRRELGTVTAVMVGAFSLVALAGSRPSDPTLFDPGTGLVENPCGPVGANVAWILHTLVGYGAWGLVVPMAVGLLWLAGREVLDWVRWTATGVLFVALLAALHLGLGPGELFAPGGALGALAATTLTSWLGPVGAVLALVTVTLVGVTFLAHIQWGRVLARAVDKLEIWVPNLALWVLDKGHYVLVFCQRAVGWSGRTVFWVVRGIGGRAVDAAVRMFRSLTRGSADEVRWEQAALPVEVDLELADSMFENDGDTVVGAVAALVEVEWDETECQPVAVPPAKKTPLIALPRPTPEPVELSNEPESSSISYPPALPPPSWDLPSESSDDASQPSAVSVRSDPDGSAAGKTPVAVVAAVRPAPVASAAAVDAPSAAAAVPAATKTARPGIQVSRPAYLDAPAADDDGEALEESFRWELPPLALLDPVPPQDAAFDEIMLHEMAATVEEKLETFKIGGGVTAVRPGPVVTTFEFEPAPGIKVSRIANLSDDLAMALKVKRVRIVAPIPGRGCVGIEIPSMNRLSIYLREVMASKVFRSSKHQLPVIIGKDVEGAPVVGDLAKMPHLLIAGTTGSGKSVGVNGMLMSLLFKMTPDELRLLLVDPKMLEFKLYDGIPHLLHPVVTDPSKAAAALSWACKEMDRRYELLARWGTRNIKSYNSKVEAEAEDWTLAKARKYMDYEWLEGDGIPQPEKLPFIVVVIDELADLMMTAGKDVETSIVRIAQKARACGIHLIVATQRPSTDVVTGLIKTNLPTRISFQLRTGTDSRVILDQNGAERLLGRGDLLYLPPGVGDLQRCHGAFVSDDEVARITDSLKDQAEPVYVQGVTETEGDKSALLDEEMDDLYEDAVEIVVSAGKASTSMVQRHLKIGYNRAARIIDLMEAAGVVGPADGARPREVLLTR